MASANGLNPSFQGNVTAGQQLAVVAGGNPTPAISFGLAGYGIYFGSGAPTISAIKGSLYINTTGTTTATRMYINNGTTTWVAFTTAS